MGKKPPPPASAKRPDAPSKAASRPGINIFAGLAVAPPSIPAPAAPASDPSPASDLAGFVTGDKTRSVSLSSLVRDPRAQPRAQLNTSTVDTYREAMAGEGDTAPSWGSFPPVVAFGEGERFYLADGFHRLAAAEAAGLVEVRADVRPGTLRDAILYSVGANAAHGLPRSNEDKRRAAFALLLDDEWTRRSDRWIADQAKVSNRFVSTLRAELARGHATVNASQSDSSPPTVNASQSPPAALGPPAPRERIGRDGRTTRTEKIGRSERPAKPAAKNTPGELGKALATLTRGAQTLKPADRRWLAGALEPVVAELRRRLRGQG